MNMTGVTRMFNEMDSLFGKFMVEVEELMYPRVTQLEVHDQKFDKLRELTNWEQRKQMDKHGYTLMTEDQLRIVYGKDGESLISR